MAAHHHLPARPDTVLWGHMEAGAPPALTIAPGDRVTVETVSGGPRNLPAPESGLHVPENHLAILRALRPDPGPHILTGPIRVAGAEPGDRLVVEIEEIALAQDWGWNAIEPGFGLFPDLAQDYRNLVIPIDRARACARLPWGVEAPLAPFFGILAVAPPAAAGRVSSVPPGAHGGNIDNRHLRPGARISFPVFCEGALFVAGDGHALQGDGEVCDTALETSLTGRFRFDLVKGAAPERPEVTVGDLVITMGFDADLLEAARQATRQMMGWIGAHCGLSPGEAYRHCSLFAHLHVTQVVNGQRGVHCLLDRRSLPG